MPVARRNDAPPLLAGLLQKLAHRLAGRVRVIGIAVPTGDPVRGGDDIDARLKHFDVEVLVGEHPMERQYVRALAAMISSILPVALDPVWGAAPASSPLSSLAHLVARITMHANEFQIRPQARSALIISEPTLPVATWNTRSGAFIRFSLSELRHALRRPLPTDAVGDKTAWPTCELR